MRQLTTIVGSLMVAGLIACQQSAAGLGDRDVVALRAVFDSTVQYIRAGDHAAWALQFSEDATVFLPNAPPLSGRAALLAWNQSMPEAEAFEFSDVQVTGAGDLAYGSSAYAMKLKGLPADTGRQLVVFRRAPGGKWEVVAASINSILPIPPAAAPQPR